MITCSNCNKQLEDGAKFCDGCGTPVVQPAKATFCPNCGTRNDTGSAFCQGCGTPLSTDYEKKDVTVETQGEKPKKNFKISKKFIAIGASVVAIVLVLAMVLPLLFSGGGISNYATYIKDAEIYYSSLDKKDPWQLTSEFVGSEYIDNSDLSDSAFSIGIYYMAMAEDNETIFYIDKIDTDSEGVTVYYRNVNKPKKEAEKLDSDILRFVVNDSASIVTYIKGSDKTLYQNDLKDKEKIADGVEYAEVSDDGKKIYYVAESELYFKEKGKDSEKIDNNAENFVVSEDFKTVYYEKEDGIYKKTAGKDKEKIVSDVLECINIYESGEIYYFKESSSEINYADYLTDEYKESDAAMTEPEYPDYPDYWDYDTEEDYELAIDAYEKACEQYEKDSEAWYEKCSRDSIRESLDETGGKSFYALYYYDGKTEHLLSEYCTDIYNYVHAKDSCVIAYSTYDMSLAKTADISEIEYMSQIDILILSDVYDSMTFCIAIGNESSAIEQNDASHFDISEDGRTVYFIDNKDESGKYGDLYKVEISGKKAGKPELYDSDVYAVNAYFISFDKFVYFKDVKSDSGDMYLDKKQIDSDVYWYSVNYLEESGAIVYMTDWNDDKDEGTLKIWKKGKSEKIADDVCDLGFTPEEDIMYMTDYSTKSCTGTLCVYKNGKSQKVDDDVIAIIPYYESINLLYG